MDGNDSKEPRADPVSNEHFRLDLIPEVAKVDEEQGLVWMYLRPDPRRYEQIERDEDGNWYLDKYFDIIFNFDEFVQAPMNGLPIHASERTVDSAEQYANERRDAVSKEIKTGEYIEPAQPARAHLELSLPDERNLGFLSLDICGSTALRKGDSEAFETAHKLIIQELGTTVAQFQGSLLKATGDGFIAYLDVPSVNVLADSLVDLGGTLLHVLHSAVNPALEDAGLPAVSVRIGADYGSARIREVHVPATGYLAPEVTSDALNRAVKIEQSCSPDTFRIGFDLYRLAHVQWLERCHEVDFNGAAVGIPEYKVYEVR